MMSRDDLGKIYETYRQTGLGVEVGCYDGTFTKTLAKHYQGEIWAVDYFSDQDFLWYPGLKEKTYENLAGFNCRIVEATSLEAAEMLEDDSLDWVYIDANHSYESAKEDIAAWYPKVRSGGVVSGHDYIEDYRVPAYEFGVYQAVNEFCKENNYQPEILHDRASGADFASWYFIKR